LFSTGGQLTLEDPVPTQGFQKFADIRTNDIDVCAILRADPTSDLLLVRAGCNEFEDFRSGEIEAEHLALLDIQQDGAVLRLGSPDRSGNRDHQINRPLPGIWSGEVGIREFTMEEEKIASVAAIATIRVVFREGMRA
jgi:hypothetical protein